MKNILTIALLAFTLKLHAQNLKALDNKNGFRELSFGDTIVDFSSWKVIGASEDSTQLFYERLDDKLKIGDAVVKISYVFFKKKFYCVFIQTEGFENSHSIYNTLKEMYGKGYKSNPYIERYYWWGKKVSLSYEQNSVSGRGSVIMSNIEIERELEEFKKQKAIKAKEDF